MYITAKYLQISSIKVDKSLNERRTCYIEYDKCFELCIEVDHWYHIDAKQHKSSHDSWQYAFLPNGFGAAILFIDIQTSEELVQWIQL